ncbi:MAG: DNA mismatch repair protein MutS [Chloroflexi bacterium]|nr:DNA mismatch repair protein MutS [Chloroflexota bacterium]
MVTPARQQFLDLKAQHPDALLLFRMGDFYETFDEDAEVAARVLGIALTSRPMGKDEGRIPLAGIPYHQLDRYLDQLVAAGYRVAIGEQVSLPPSRGGDPGLVQRRVTRVVTPGTVDRGELLTERGHNWLVAVAGAPGGRWALAACDVTTGELELQVVDADALAGEWTRLRPREAVVPEGVEVPRPPAAAGDVMLTARPAREFLVERGAARLAERLHVTSLDGFGLEGLEAATGAAGALVGYLEEMWPQALPHLRAPRAVRATEVVYLDPQTRRNLELFEAPGRLGAGSTEASLVGVLDRTLTPMGARLLRLHLGRPLRRAADAEARLDDVAAFVDATMAREALRAALRGVPDLERLLGRVHAGTAHARHLVQLRHGFERLPEVRAAAGRAGEAALRAAAGVGGVEEVAAAIEAALEDDAPAEVGESPTVRAGFDAEIDRLRGLTTDARSALARLEAAERERTGIASLKVGYNRVFGYYLECPRAQAEKAPPDYEARQTLANAQRFRFGPLSALEAEILGAKELLETAERGVVERLCAQVAAAGTAVERAAEGVARFDVAAALAVAAADGNWVRPQLHDDGPIEIEGGRHPVVEAQAPRGTFVPNDTFLGAAGGTESPGGSEGGHPDLVVLTGPNMAGKSTYLRQTALVVLLAQCGSFVPATRARIGMVDRIFSRVGAQDDIAAGQSTFMVEMLETATILHNATERSLVILDEVGRGTSTYDGLAIARAVIEYLHHRPQGTPRTLFATHYHELTALAGTLPRVANRSVAVREEGGEVVFLHRIVDGGADRSYGVHVAALAGLPRAVVSRARELLAALEAGAVDPLPTVGRAPDRQMSLLAAEDEAVLQALADLDPDVLTPLAALQTLYDLRAQARRRLGAEG